MRYNIKDSNTRNSVDDFLSDIIGPEGIKTDVAIKIAPATIPVLIISIFAAIVLGGIATHFILRKIAKK